MWRPNMGAWKWRNSCCSVAPLPIQLARYGRERKKLKNQQHFGFFLRKGPCERRPRKKAAAAFSSGGCGFPVVAFTPWAMVLCARCENRAAERVGFGCLSKSRWINAGGNGLVPPPCCGNRLAWAPGRRKPPGRPDSPSSAASPLPWPPARHALCPPAPRSPPVTSRTNVSLPRARPNAITALTERPHPPPRGGPLRQPEGGHAAAGEGRFAPRDRQGELPPACPRNPGEREGGPASALPTRRLSQPVTVFVSFSHSWKSP